MKTFLFVLFSLMMVAVAGCGSNSTDTVEVPTIMVKAEGFRFTPDEIVVKVGQEVRLTVDDGDALVHDFSIAKIPLVGEMRVLDGPDSGDHDMSNMGGEEETLDVHIAVDPGGASRIVFTPAEAGTYRFICTVEGHEEAGMVGTLVVEP